MKTMVLIASLFCSAAFARSEVNHVLMCSATDALEQKYQIVVDITHQTATLNIEVPNSQMPPYPLQTLDNYKLDPLNMTKNPVKIHGRAVRMTGGMVGQLTLTLKQTKTSPVLSGTGIYRKSSNSVRMLPDTPLNVSCSLK